MGNDVSKHNSEVLNNLKQSDIIKVHEEPGCSYYLYSGDASKLYPLNEETKEYFDNPLTRNESRPSVTYQEAVGNFKCDQISESQWIYETEGKNVDVLTFNKKMLQVLLPGDIITLCYHNVLYIGDGHIIHLVSSMSTCERLTAKHKKELASTPHANGLVTKDIFLELAKNKRAYKSNLRNLFGYTAKQIIRRAESQIGPAFFSLLTQNCRHFVVEMKYGWQVCKKVRPFRIGKSPSGLVHKSGFLDDQPVINSQCPASEGQVNDIELQEILLLDDDVDESDWVTVY